MIKLLDNNGNPVSIDGKSPTGEGFINLVPFVTSDGVPKVIVMVRLDTSSSYEATLDGHPAVAVFIGEERDGTGNAPWEFGHLLAKTWDDAEKLAGRKKNS